MMAPDTVSRKSSLENFFKKRGTSDHGPYHTDLLVFCLKFRFSPVSPINVSSMTYNRKAPQGKKLAFFVQDTVKTAF